ncbi:MULTISPECIES: PQQ-dependent sugar dehydrogenase [unclassified Microbacterium]|uniref:PQQ-dependent sugar dehydrogenase n=1 Tax=unclassified Microbacterium TaxID=2609290 RepID=UPI00301B6B45
MSRIIRRSLLPLAALLVSVVLVSCSSPMPPAPTSAPLADRKLGEPSVLVEGLEVPWSLAFHGDVALVSERDTARILEVSEDGSTREVAVIDGAEPRGEGGLLGIAVREGDLYAYFTAAGENRVERYRLAGNPGETSIGPGETIIEGLPASTNHNGGRIAFGPDGMLYVTVGDAGDRESAQDPDSLSGKILRLTPDGAIPTDNPFEGSPIYSLGHRNPQGIAWDDDGSMYASEFGQDTWDELNVIEPGSNYGWPDVEGVASAEGFVDPVQQWAPATASPSGVAITAGSIFIANLRGERLREVPLDDVAVSAEYLSGTFGRLRDVTVAPDGALWVLTNNTDGRGDPQAGDDRIIRIPVD